MNNTVTIPLFDSYLIIYLMAQLKHDILKEYLQKWMVENADTYDAFEKMMNEQSDEGYQKILFVATSIFPKYKKIIEKKMHSKNSDDISDIEDLFSEEQIGNKFLEQLHLNDDEISLPIVLSWLYFGRSFENMVERGEELLESSQTKRFYKSLISKTIKLLIKKSKELGLRTEQDWIDYRNLQAAIKDDIILDWALSEETTMSKNPESKTLQKKNNDIPLDEMILLSDEKKNKLLFKIREYLETGAIGKRIALMILALRQLGYLPATTTNRQLFTAIKNAFGIYIGSDKSIYQYLDETTAKQFQSEIDTLKNFFQIN